MRRPSSWSRLKNGGDDDDYDNGDDEMHSFEAFLGTATHHSISKSLQAGHVWCDAELKNCDGLLSALKPTLKILNNPYENTMQN